MLLEKNIVPLFETIYNETDLGTEDKILKSKINLASLMLIHLRKKIFYTIYCKYFKKDKDGSKIKIDKRLCQ